MTTYTYDGFDRLSATSWPDSSYETLGYDADSNVVSRGTRAGQAIAYAYDTLNRLTTKTPPAPWPVVSYAYDLAGRVTSVSDTSAAIQPIATPANTTAYTTSTAYDALNRPVGVTWDPAPAATPPAAGTVVAFGHSYNKANQRTAQTVSDTAWLAYPAATPATTAYTANALNQYTAVGAVTPAYDGNANLTFDGTSTLGHDPENRLVSATGGGNTAAYAFDPRGRRKVRTVNGTTTITVTGADNRELLDYDGATGTLLRWYAYGPGPNAVLNQMNVAAASRDTLLPDLLGSVVASVDSGTGNIAPFGYQPYGTTSAAPAQFGYTGQRVDQETGLYYYRARHYSPAWGRFTQADPIGYQGGVNLYGYVGNDPLNLTDSGGLAPDQSMFAAFPSGLIPETNIQAFAPSPLSLPQAAGVLAAGLPVMPIILGVTVGIGVALYPSDAGTYSSCSTGGCERDYQYVVRGGLSTATQFRQGSGVTIDANGLLQGVSVQTFPNTSVQQLSQRQWIPNNQIGVSNVAAINSANGTVVPSPTPTNPYHATLGGITPEVAERLFTPTIPNPNLRIQPPR